MQTSALPMTGAALRAAPRSRGWLVPAAVAVVLAFAPLVLETYYQELVVKIMIYAIFALSLELLAGSTGLVSLGHAAFFGIGAYATALAAPQYDAGSPLLLLALSMLAAAGYALLVGALSLRTREVYFIMVTLAFAQMAYFVFHDTPIGGGSDGMYLMLRPVLKIGGATLVDFEQPRHLYFVALGLLVLCYAFLALVLRSRFGHALTGIRINEQRMGAAGFQTYRYKLAAFVLAGALAGMAGFLYVAKNGVVNPELLSWHESGAVLMMIILGGLGSLRGAVIGAAAFVLLKEFYSSEALLGAAIAGRWQLTLGLTMIAFVALLPKGLIGIGRRFTLNRKKS
jgi:branched-chain amino acid transport system permease protein